MDDQRTPGGEVPLSALLAPSRGLRLVRGPLSPEGWVIYKEKMSLGEPSDKYIAACRREGLQIPERKSQKQELIDAEEFPASLQIFYVRCAARDGDWRRMRGIPPTPRMQNLFVTARAKYLAWKKRRDEEDEREESLPKFWFEIQPGRFVLATSEEKALAFVESVKSIEIMYETHQRAEIDIDTSKTCPRCAMRRVEPGKTRCGNCIQVGPT